MVERKKFLLRLPPKLHEELRGWAEDEMRSLNAQIEYLLRQALVRRNKATARKVELADEVGDGGVTPEDGA